MVNSPTAFPLQTLEFVLYKFVAYVYNWKEASVVLFTTPAQMENGDY